MKQETQLVYKARSLGPSTLIRDLHENGFAGTPNGIILSKKFVDEITSATVTGIADALHNIQAKVDPTYPSDHKAAMRVPKGGSSCSNCEYLADNKTDCTNKHFQKWNGGPKIPAPIDEYCSDWFEPGKKIEAAEDKKWHGVDLDGTIAEYHGFEGNKHIGKPIQGEALEQVKAWLKKGEKVKLFTARASEPEAIKPMQEFCKKVFGQVLEITDKKDPNMIDLLEDRAHHVEKNTGEIVAYGTSEGVKKEWDTRGRGRKEVYHGTIGKLADKIMKEGLTAKTKFKGFKMVWATKDKEEALGYGISKVAAAKKESQVALIVIDPVKANFSQAYEDMNMDYVVSKGAPPAAIKRIEVYDRNALYEALNDYRDIDTFQRAKNLPLPKPVRVIKSQEDEIYVTLVPDDTITAMSETSFEGQHKGSLWNGIRLVGFTGPEEEALRATLSRIPPELLTYVKCVQSAKELNAKHGRYIPEEEKILFNPGNLLLRQRFGKGEFQVSHADLTVVHEVGHSLYDNLSPENRARWQALSGWMEGTEQGQASAYVESRPGWEPYTSKWTHKAGAKFPRWYAEKNPNEDFADCFAFFLQNKAHQIGPEKRAFFEDYIKEHVLRYPQASIQSPIRAYGTSPGVRKAWDTRGRGRHGGALGTGRTPGRATGQEGQYSRTSVIGRLYRNLQQSSQSLKSWRNRLGQTAADAAIIRLDRHGLRSGRWRVTVDGDTLRLVRTPSPAPPVTQSIGKTDQGTGLPLVTPASVTPTQRVPGSVSVGSGSANFGLNVLRDGQWHDRSEFDRAISDYNISHHFSFTAEDRLDRLRDRLPEQGYKIEENATANTLRVVPSSSTAALPSSQALRVDETSRQSLGGEPPSRIANPAPGQRQPVGFLTKDPSTFPSNPGGEIRISPSDIDKFREAFKMDPTQYKDTLLKGVDSNLAARTSMRIASNSGGTGWQIVANGPGFEISRSLELNNKSVYHGYFTMSPHMQGKGFAKTIFSNSLDLYDHLGLEKIGVSASLAGGGYAWARFGFVPDRLSWSSLASNVAWNAQRSSELTPDIKAQVDVISKIQDPRAIWLLAGLKDAKGESVGAKLLRGTDWHGTLDLNNREQYAVVRDYSGRHSAKQ